MTELKTYAVDLDFVGAPTWGGEYKAYSQAGAIQQATEWARGCGYHEPIRKAKAREVRAG